MARLKVILDTNVVISAHLNEDGFERFVLDLAMARKVQCFVSLEILLEYEGVLRRPKFAIDPGKVELSLALIKARTRTVRPKRKLAVTRDPADNKFLECAEAAAADYLVTGNKRHFPDKFEKTQVVNSREFIKVITPDLERLVQRRAK